MYLQQIIFIFKDRYLHLFYIGAKLKKYTLCNVTIIKASYILRVFKERIIEDTIID